MTEKLDLRVEGDTVREVLHLLTGHTKRDALTALASACVMTGNFIEARRIMNIIEQLPPEPVEPAPAADLSESKAQKP